jgi:hypothetical protein
MIYLDNAATTKANDDCLQTFIKYNTDNYISYTLHYEVNSYTTNLTSEDIDAFHKKVIDTFASNDIKLKV